jgi:hypothetical protein
LILGIVGHAADKFTPLTEYYAKKAIRDYLLEHKPERVISGGCHLGGVDKWAINLANVIGIPFTEYLPKNRNWWPTGYKPRNLLIANNSDKVLVIVAKEYHSNYSGMRFDGCYHCGDRNPPHVKSGGCLDGMEM